MLDNVIAIGESSAIASICFEDPNLNPELQVQFIKADIELDQLVQAIGDHYEDQSVYLTYVLFVESLQESYSLQKDIRSTYGGCGQVLLNDLNSKVSADKSKILNFLSDNPRSP